MSKNKAWGGVTYNKGFTLIELLAVIVILAIIALIATPIVLDIIDSVKKSSVEATMKNIEKAALLEYSDLVLDGKEKEEIIYNCYDGKCTYNGKTLNVKGDMPDRGRIIVNEDGATFENIIIKGYNCIKENNKFTCNNTGLTKVNGTSILIDNNKTTEIENYRIYGNSIQNGEPTPDTPVDIESVGDLVTLDNCSSYGSDACNNVGKYVIPIKVTGKNLFDISKINSFKRYDYLTDVVGNDSINNGVITSNTSATSKYVLLYDSKIFLDEGVYTIQANFMADKESGNKGVTLGFYDYLNNKSYVTFHTLSNYKTWERKEFKINISSPLNFAVVAQSTGDFDDYINLNIKIKDIQLEYGDKATEYEPYKETITNIYLDSPLRSIGEYADYIDFKTGKIVRNINKKIFDSTENFDNQFGEYDSDTKIFFAYQFNQNLIGDPDSLCNYFRWYKYPSSVQYYDSEIGFNFNPELKYRNYIYFKIQRSLLDTQDEDGFKKWIKDKYNKNNPLRVYYIRNKQIEEEIELPELSINKDTSVISVNTNIAPSNIELEYYR